MSTNPLPSGNQIFDSEEDEFGGLPVKLDSEACEGIDSTVAAAAARGCSPFNLVGYGLRAAPSPSKNCSTEAHKMIQARYQKAVASKVRRSSVEDSHHTPDPSTNSRITTPVPEGTSVDSPQLTSGPVPPGPSRQGAGQELNSHMPTPTQETPLRDFPLPLTRAPWPYPYPQHHGYGGYHPNQYPGYAYPPFPNRNDYLPHASTYSGHPTANPIPPAIVATPVVPQMAPGLATAPAPLQQSTTETSNSSDQTALASAPKSLRLEDLGPLQPLIPQPPPPPVRQSIPGNNISAVDQDVDWDFDTEEPADNSSDSINVGGCPSNESSQMVEKLVNNINTSIQIIAQKTGCQPDAIFKRVYGRITGSNSWTDYAKYLKGNLVEEMEHLPPDFDCDCGFPFNVSECY